MKKTITVLMLLTLLASCGDVIVEEPKNEPIPLGIVVTISSISNEPEATGVTILSNKKMFASASTNVYVEENGYWKLSANLNTPVYDLLARNDSVFALTEITTKKTGEKFASNGSFYLPAGEVTWKKDESGKFKNLNRQIGIAQNSKGVQYRIKQNKVTVGDVTYDLPSDVEKYVGNKWVKLEGMAEQAKFKLNNIFIGKDDQRAYVTGEAGTFDSENHFQPSSSGKAPVLLLFGDL